MPDLSKLEVCFLAGTLGVGGSEQQLFYVARALRALGARPRVLCLTRGEHWERRIEALGVPVRWVGRKGSRMLRLAAIVLALREHRPDIVQSQHFFTNLYAFAAGRLLGSGSIGALRSDGLAEIASAGSVLGSLSLRAPKVIAANSLSAMRNAVRLGVSPSRLRLLPNVVDTELFAPPPLRPAEPVRVLAVGRLDRVKRFDVFLEAIARVHRLAPVPVKAVIAGDGRERGALERLAERLGLGAGAVEFAGTVTDMPALYKTAHCLAMTSEREGTPNAILEAMACGMPVVATAVGGIPDLVVDGETGFLVPSGDVEEVTRRLLTLASDASLRRELGERARAFVVAHHAPGVLPGVLEEIYTEAIN